MTSRRKFRPLSLGILALTSNTFTLVMAQTCLKLASNGDQDLVSIPAKKFLILSHGLLWQKKWILELETISNRTPHS